MNIISFSALNIVGEKDMQCAVCKANVENFHLKSFNTKETTARLVKTDVTDSLLPSAFDVNPFLVPPINPTIPRSSTPLGLTSSTARAKDSVVLRIDNVPWVCFNQTSPLSTLTPIAGYYSPYDRQLAEATRRPCSCLAR